MNLQKRNREVCGVSSKHDSYFAREFTSFKMCAMSISLDKREKNEEETPSMRVINFACRREPDIVFNPGRGSFVDKASKKQLQGVHSVIRNVFQPIPSEQFHAYLKEKKVRTHDVRSGIQRGVSKEMKGTMSNHVSDSRGCLRVNPKEHGTLVDQQVAEFVQCGGSKEMFLNKVGIPDKCVMTLIDFLEARHYIPIKSQVIVGSLLTSVATAIDLLCRNRNHEIVVIELKATRHTCMDYYQHQYGNLNEPLNFVPMSLCNLDLLQLALTTRLLRSHAKVPVREAKLIRLSGNALACYDLPVWAANDELMNMVDNELVRKNLERNSMRQQKRKNKRVQAARRAQRTRIHKPRARKGDGKAAYMSSDLNEI